MFAYAFIIYLFSNICGGENVENLLCPSVWLLDGRKRVGG